MIGAAGLLQRRAGWAHEAPLSLLHDLPAHPRRLRLRHLLRRCLAAARPAAAHPLLPPPHPPPHCCPAQPRDRPQSWPPRLLPPLLQQWTVMLQRRPPAAAAHAGPLPRRPAAGDAAAPVLQATAERCRCGDRTPPQLDRPAAQEALSLHQTAPEAGARRTGRPLPPSCPGPGCCPRLCCHHCCPPCRWTTQKRRRRVRGHGPSCAAG